MSGSHVAISRRKLLATAALFSTGGVCIKSVHMSGPQVACIRSAFATVALLLFIPAARRNWNLRTLLVALAYSVTLASFVIANKLTTGANAIFIQDTAPIFIVFLSAVLLQERPSRGDFVFMVPLATGLALFFAGNERAVVTATNPALGNLVACASAVSWSLVIVGFRWLSRFGDDGALQSATLGNLIAALICLPFALPLPSARAVDWVLLLYLGVFQIGLAYLLMTDAMKFVPAVEASLLLLLEPVLNPIWTWLVWHERPSNLALVGGAIILGSTLIKAGANTWRAPGAS